MEKKKNNLTIVVVILIILVLGLGGFIIYDKVLNNEKNDNNYSLNILKKHISDCVVNQDCENVVYTIKTNNSKAKIYTTIDNFVLYNDGGLKIYNHKTKEIVDINLETAYESYSFHLSEDKNKIIGVIGYSNLDNNQPKSVYYNLVLNKKMYENKYVVLHAYTDDFIAASDTLYPSHDHLLYTSREEEFLSGYHLYFKKTRNGYYIVDETFYEYPAIYTKDKKLIASNVDYKNLRFIDDYLYIINDNKIQKYDLNGNLVETISKYLKPLGFIKEFGENDSETYIAYVKDDILEVENLKTQEGRRIADWKDEYELTNYSVYIKDENKICIAILKEFLDYNKIVGIEYYYDLTTGEITSKKINSLFTYQALS